MTNLLPYILKLSIGLCVIYVFYQLFLRRLTFYNWNRWYLLLYSILCFVLPFINVFEFVTAPAPEASSIINIIPVIDYSPQVAESDAMDWKQVAVVVVLAGIVLLMIRLLIQYLSLVKMRTHARLLYDNNIRLYHIDKPVIPFSFGNAIYINQYQHSQEELSDIIRHEFIHVKQRHTVDMIWSELLCIVNWYNPFAWLLKKAIRQNLEFIADHQVLQTGFDRKQYQYLLLKVIGSPTFSIASNFNFSSLKKRIAMMNKAKTARVHLIRFLFILPLLAVILLAFRNINQQQQVLEDPAPSPAKLEEPVMPLLEQPVKISLATNTDTVPEKKIVIKEKSGVRKDSIVSPADIESIHVYKQNGENRITIELKNGDVDVFDLSSDEARKRFSDKYGGELPKVTEAKPAPDALSEVIVEGHPAPPSAPLKEVIVEGYAAPKPPAAPAPPDYNCFNEKGYCITIADNNGECIVIVKNKDQKIVEAVQLSDWNENDKYKKKYGDIPPAPVKRIKIYQGKPAQPAQPGKPVTFEAKPAKPVTIALAPAQPAVAASWKPSTSIKQVTRVKEWSVMISGHTSREQLEVIKETLASHGHELVIEDISYTDGLLTVFNALIISKDGGKGTIKTKDMRKGSVEISGGKDSQGKEFLTSNIKGSETVL